MLRPKFTEKQLIFLAEILALPCCHVSETHAVLVVESEAESKILDELQNPPGETHEPPILSAQVRLADGYGEHYILIRPIKKNRDMARSGPDWAVRR